MKKTFNYVKQYLDYRLENEHFALLSVAICHNKSLELQKPKKLFIVIFGKS